VINPTNPLNLFCSETNSYFTRYSTDGGQTWKNSNTSAIPAGPAGFGADVQAAWDSFGNLFMTRFGAGQSTIVARSGDGGATFKDPRTVVTTSSDQQSIAVGPSGVAGVPGSVWISVNTGPGGGNIVAAGAPVLGFDSVGAFNAPETPPGSGTGDFGSITVGPAGQVMVSYQTTRNNGPDNVSVNLDPDGLGPAGFNAVITATSTNVGGFSSIPAQSGRTIDAESNLAYDRSGGTHNGRVYLVYVDRPSTSSADTDVYVRFSDNNGTNWSGRVRVNDDTVGNGKSQFQPAIAVDQTTGNVGVTWYDTRNSAAANNTAQVFGSASFDGDVSWCPNLQISTGTTNAVATDPGFDFGDYDTMSFVNGSFYRSWADSSNSTGDNPNGTANTDIYTAKVTILTAPTVTAAADQTAVEGALKSFDLGSFAWCSSPEARGEMGKDCRPFCL